MTWSKENSSTMNMPFWKASTSIMSRYEGFSDSNCMLVTSLPLFSIFFFQASLFSMKTWIGSFSTGYLNTGRIWIMLNCKGYELFWPVGNTWNQARPLTSLRTLAVLRHSIADRGLSLSISRHYSLASTSASLICFFLLSDEAFFSSVGMRLRRE